MAIYQGKSSLNHMNGQLDIFIFFTIVNLQVIKRKKLPAALRLAFHDCVGELISVLNVLYSLGQSRPSGDKAWQDSRARLVKPA